ncbi:MAG TPA: hypothetical protein VE398_18665 [Acidobacteriota bacterium]|nr:hypothetical protein [Acidobacteriota bacterium]
MKDPCSTGLLEYHRRSSKCITYQLTAAGRDQLQNIQEELVHEMVSIFAEAKERIRERILASAHKVLQRVIQFGSGHLADLVFHALEPAKFGVVGICNDDPARIGQEWCGRQVISRSQIRYIAPDAVVVATGDKTSEICESLRQVLDRGIQVLRLDVAPNNRVELPTVESDADPQAVNGRK